MDWPGALLYRLQGVSPVCQEWKREGDDLCCLQLSPSLRAYNLNQKPVRWDLPSPVYFNHLLKSLHLLPQL